MILGAVLAGGRSRRFGTDKALALLGGRPLIDHACSSLSVHVDAVVVCGREMAGRTSLPDRPGPGLGPLGGLNAALHHAVDLGAAGVLTTGCDTPVFPRAIAQALIGQRAAVLDRHWLLGYWPAALVTKLDAHLAADGDRSIRGWIATTGARIVPFAGAPLPNVNTPDDLAGLADDIAGYRDIER